MKKIFQLTLISLFMFSFTGVSSATNGDQLIGIGPVSRAMGGVGIAAPQDAISAVFANPAAMCFGSYCPGSQFIFAGTVFMPNTRTRVTADAAGLDTGWQDSESDMYLIPAIGISTPISRQFRFGLAAYGVSGLGVDYRDKFDLNPMTPEIDDVYTNLQVMKFASSLSYLINPNFSVGAALHANYGALDLQAGTSTGFSVGAQLGALYKSGPISVGVVYVTPQKINHENVADFDEDGSADDLELESPQSIGFGVAYEAIPGVLLVETDAKWLNWADADGYKDFDWTNQWVYAIGVQYKPVPALALRAGFNYGKNPVEDHDGWDGTTFESVQGKQVSRFNYEVLRIAGFPAIVEKHLTAGIGYKISQTVLINLGYMHAFKNTIKEDGTYFGMPASVSASLKENSIDFGITWTF